MEFQLMPGHAFLRPETELTTRLCFVDFDGDAAARAVDNGEEVTRTKVHFNILGHLLHLKVDHLSPRPIIGLIGRKSVANMADNRQWPMYRSNLMI